MQRIQDTFISSLKARVRLKNKIVLEIGCGTGRITEQLANECRQLTAIAPDPENIKAARRVLNNRVCFFQAIAQKLSDLPFIEFDLIIFTLSFHHIPEDARNTAISEAVRLTKKDGCIVFLEPALDGSFYEAEARFDAYDGDEREAKRKAANNILKHPGLRLEGKIRYHTAFHFNDTHDFVISMNPIKNTHEIHPFLVGHDFVLQAPRVMYITRPVKA